MTPTPQFTAELTFHFCGHGPDRRHWFVFDESHHRRVPMQMNGVEDLHTVGMWVDASATFRTGDSTTVRCVVIAPDIFSAVVKPGVTFELWDAGLFASGKVIERIEAGWPPRTEAEILIAEKEVMPCKDEPTKGETNDASMTGQLMIFLGALGIMVGLMYYTYTYPYPDGEPPSVSQFTVFFFRELLILALAFIGLMIVITGWGIRLFRAFRGGSP